MMARNMGIVPFVLFLLALLALGALIYAQAPAPGAIQPAQATEPPPMPQPAPAPRDCGGDTHPAPTSAICEPVTVGA